MSKTTKKVISFIFGIALIAISAVSIYFFINSRTSHQLTCTSDTNNITILYSNMGITGFNANGLEYNLETEQEKAKQLGLEQYLDDFSANYTATYSGICNKAPAE